MSQNYIKNEEDLKMNKAKKNLIYVAMLSIIMLFGGLTSAYIVSMGDSFWLKLSISSWPIAFWISTGIMLIGSISIQLALFYAKKGQLKRMKILLLMTLFFALSFIYTQYLGYINLAKNGIHLTGSGIIVKKGKYGDLFKVKYKGSYIKVDGNNFSINAKKMSEDDFNAYKKFMQNFILLENQVNQEFIKKEVIKINNYGDEFQIFYLNNALNISNGKLVSQKYGKLKFTERIHLSDLSKNVRDSRGDFFAKGDLGKDFHIYFKGDELDYFNRKLHLKGSPLPSYLQNKAEQSQDTSSSYLWLITILHLLHVVVTIFYILKLVLNSFTGKISKSNNISLSLGVVFWHFLGFLWLYLLLFFLFIH